MKALLLLMAVCSLPPLFVKAQQPDSARVMVHYRFTHVRDTTNRQNPYTEAMVLMAGSNASQYKSYDKKLQMEAMKKKMAEMMKNPQPGPMNFSSGGKNISNVEYYQFPNEKKMIRKEKLINDYLIDEPFPTIKWKISSDTATIGSLHCQKGTTHFKGRDYEAWFCPDLPFRSGPWKLNGLPGLIVDAHDLKNEVIFKFDGIEEIVKSTTPKTEELPQSANGAHIVMIGMDDSNQDPNLIALPDKGIKATDKEFAALKEAMRKDPGAFIQSAMAASGSNVKFNRADGGGEPKIDIRVAPNTVVINNPIELPEKK
jgi:GLPGLI family protein